MTSMIFKVDPEPGTDRYMIWSTVTDMPSVIGTRDDMIAWLQPPTGDGDRAQAMRVMSRVDQTGTSDRAGRGGWHDIEPIPVGDIAPDDGWYQVGRRDLPALADAIEARDVDAVQRLFVRYA